jgi:Mn2+/Fe2+ NRAMP family transporter
MSIVAVVLFVLLTFILVPYIKRVEQKKAMETAFFQAWSKELGKKKEPRLFDIIGWLLISSVAVMVAALFIGILY